MEVARKQELKVTVFSDYICPFCYIGYLRLEKLRNHYDLKINWALVEIHPETPSEGRSISEHLKQILGELAEMAKEEGVTLIPRTTTANSHKALLLAEAAKEEGRDPFYTLHRRLFEAYFTEGQNIGDPDILRKIAATCGISEAAIERAWREERYEKLLKNHLRAAVELGVTSTPTFFFGREKLVGALSSDILLQAARVTAS